jgi:phosphoglycerate dehydrogenase-like enzyme
VNTPVVVAVGQTSFSKAEGVFTSTPGIRSVVAPDDEVAMARVIHDAGAWAAVVGTRPYVDALYTALPRGGVIARFGVGHDGIDKARATRHGLLCTNTPEVLDQSVAELAMLLILAAARHLVDMASDTRKGLWQARTGTELHGRNLTVIGCGRIGTALARIAANGFGMNVRCAGRADDFRDAVRDADFISLHIPATPENLRFLDRERLAMLAPHSWIVNTSRGAVIDESALYDALREDRIGGAALDVFSNEPYVPLDSGCDLRTLDNVILLPHVGSNTTAAGAGIARRALANVLRAAHGEFAEMDLVNREVLRAD